MAFSRLARRAVSRTTAVLLLISTVAVGMTVSAPDALAAGTVLFNQPFHDNTVDGPAGSVSIPTAPTGTNVACLSAAGNTTANPLASCPTATDAQGSGKLRLTPNLTTQEGGIFASTSVPTSQGLDVTFNSYQYGGAQGADGLAFVLAAVDPANPVTPTAIGQSGGALGYSAPSSNQPGLTCTATSATTTRERAAPTPPTSPSRCPARSWRAGLAMAASATAPWPAARRRRLRRR